MNCSLHFNENIYTQISGTANGTKIAPSIVVQFMDTAERDILENSSRPPLVWLIYTDDILGVSEGSENDVAAFKEISNPSSNFEFAQSKPSNIPWMLLLR